MKNKYKSNWEETRERSLKWWKRESMDRPLLMMRFPKSQTAGADAGLASTEDVERRWLCIDEILDRHEKHFSNSEFPFEDFPYVFAYLGPGSLGTFLGAVPSFSYDTVWYDPCFDDIEKAELVLQRNSKWWQWSLDFTKNAVKRADKQYLVTTPDFIEGLDTLDALLGTEKLLCYLVDAPGEVHRLQRQLTSLWFETFDEYYEIIKDSEGWSGSVFTLWGPGKTAKLQCDISCMLSSAMFDEFALPYLKEQSDKLDNVVYHLDGPGAIRHLDSLLTIDSLDCIQWSPGAGMPEAGDMCWDAMYKKILNAGKGILTAVEPQSIKGFIKRYGTSGISIGSSVASEKEARELVDILK